MFDEYEVKARLAPGLLAGLPIGLAALIYFGVDFGLDAGFIAAGIMLGGGVLLAKFMSELGGSKEPALFESWGGMPSVQLLRHRDPTIPKGTKARIHAGIETRAKLKMPTATQELADLIEADRTYRKAADWLRTNTRGKEKFPTVFARNCEYGFARNAFGATLLAMGVSAVVAAIILVADLVVVPQRTPDAVRVFYLTPNALVVLACIALTTVCWNFYFTAERVRLAAYAYARALLEQADAGGE
jgi:hypothetical protein